MMIDICSLSYYLFLLVYAVRHYEVVYLIHEKHAEEVGSVNEKVQGDLPHPISLLWRCNIFLWTYLKRIYRVGIDIILCRLSKKKKVLIVPFLRKDRHSSYLRGCYLKTTVDFYESEKLDKMVKKWVKLIAFILQDDLCDCIFL